MDLIERLRNWTTVYPCDEGKPDGSLYHEAADLLEAQAALIAEALPERLSEEQLNDACLSFRHDFGLLDSGDKFSVRFECAEWWTAIRKALLAKLDNA